MKLIELVNQVDWNEIASRITELYPDQVKSLDGFKKVYCLLPSLVPVKSELTIKVETIKDDLEGVEYVHVCGFYANSDKPELTYSLMVYKWVEWIGMEVSEESLQNFEPLDSLCHILWEMTFVGYDEDKIERFSADLEKE